MKLTKEQLLSDPRFRAPSGDLTNEASNALAFALDSGNVLVDVPEPVSVVQGILDAKAGCDGSYLWLHPTGDCILWDSETAAEGDPTGIHALGRWQLLPADVGELADTGEADIVW